MESINSYQHQQLEDMKQLFNSVSGSSEKQVSLTDVVIAWLTEGHAEKLRDEYLKKQTA